MSEKSQNRNKEKIFRSSRREKLGGAALAGAALVGFLGLQGQIDYDNPRAILEAGLLQSCDNADPAVLDATTKKLNTPVRDGFIPYVAMSFQNTDPLESAAYGYTNDKLSFIDYGFMSLQKEAKKHNLTIVNPASFIKDIYSAPSNQEALNAAKGYFAEFSIELTVPNDITDKIVDNNISLVDIETIKRNQLNKMLGDFAFSFSHVPKQVVAISKLENIRLVDTLGSSYNDVKGGDKVTSGNAVYLAHTINLATRYMILDSDNPGLHANAGLALLHELGHNLDGSLCGGSLTMDKDPHYTAANTFSGQTYGNIAFAESNDVIEPYGATNAAEDKATMFERLLRYRVVLSDSNREVLFEKEMLLAARIEVQVPGYTDYLKTVALRLS